MNFEINMPIYLKLSLVDLETTLPSVEIAYWIETSFFNQKSSYFDSAWFTISAWNSFITQLKICSKNIQLSSMSNNFCIGIQQEENIKLHLHVTHESASHATVSANYDFVVDEDTFSNFKEKMFTFFTSEVNIL